jgi:hypothetical protein
VTTLTRSARGLLVALAALALTGGVVFAAHALPLASTAGTQHASAITGKTIPAVRAAGTRDPAEKPDATETPEPSESADTKSTDNSTNADRPQNHGWFVSQAAKTATPDGFDNHGAYVSSVARSAVGKPDAAANGAVAKAANQD